MKEKTIGQLLEEARQKSGAAKLAGHDIMDLERFAPDTRHMITFDVLSHDSNIGFKGDHTRLFLTDEGYKRASEAQEKEYIKIKTHAAVMAGRLYYDNRQMER